MPACLTQSCKQVTVRSSSRATSVMVLPGVSAMRTASALNSGVNLRRLRGLADFVGLIDTSFIMT